MIRLLRYSSAKVIFALCVILLGFMAVCCSRKLYIQHLEADAYNIEPLSVSQLDSIVDDNVKNLMIVAHADDEILWGGGHLMSGDWLVVCITGGKSETRSQEFYDVIEASGNQGMILSYPDKIGGRRDNWAKIKENIKSDLETVLNFKEWEIAVVHNKNGEYGHTHHVNAHSYVTEIYDASDFDFPLYCFGKYYRASRIYEVKEQLEPISAEEYKFKKELAELYVSQKKTIQNLWHMARYEMWTRYEKYTEHPIFKNKSFRRTK